MNEKEKLDKIKSSKFLKDKKQLNALKEQIKREERELLYQKPFSKGLSRRFFYIFIGISFIVVFFQKKILDYQRSSGEEKKSYIAPIRMGKDNNLSHRFHALLPKDVKAKKADFTEVVGENQELKKALELQKETIRKLNLPLEIENKFGMIFRFVPRGDFMMGTPKTEAKRGETEVLHKSRVANHMYVGKFEVTQEVWQKVMGKNPAYFKDNPQKPVEEVSYVQAQEFVKRLSRLLGVRKGIYRLLSEREWEYSCRAGSSKAFYFGDDPFKLYLFGEYNDENGRSTKAVGGRLPNIWGLYDMHGNVAEWTRSKFWFYAVAKNIYAHTWDRPIYDGDVPMDRDKPFDNFKLKNFTVGRQDNIFYCDDNSNGRYDRNELIWADNEKGAFARFDYGKDKAIYTIYDDVKKFNGRTGIQKNLYYSDLNNNRKWDKGEKIWSYDLKARDTKKYILRGGGYNDYSRNCRSGARLAIFPKSHSNVWGFRIVRYLAGFQVPFEDSYIFEE